MENKLCSKCKLCKPTSEYSKSKRGANGLRSNCKACDRVRCKEWKDKNPNKVRATNQKRDQQRKAEPEKEMLRRAKKRATIRNIEFSIGVEDILIPYECPVLNKKLQYSNSQSVHRFAPSLDRKDITKGYIPRQCPSYQLQGKYNEIGCYTGRTAVVCTMGLRKYRTITGYN